MIPALLERDKYFRSHHQTLSIAISIALHQWRKSITSTSSKTERARKRSHRGSHHRRWMLDHESPSMKHA